MSEASASSSVWSGRVALGPGWAMFDGRAGDNRTHRHPALQVALGDGQPVQAEIEGRPLEAAGLLIGPNVSHRLQSCVVRLLYVERASASGRRLAATCPQGARALSAGECALLRSLWMSQAEAPMGIEALVATLTAAPAEAKGESASLSRLREVIARLPLQVPENQSLDAMAAAAALSPSRFAHAFREQTGMAVRPYLRWLRLACALQAAARGQSLTAAAHEAGFADAAHFSRTMRRHFGVTPGSVLASLRG